MSSEIERESSVVLAGPWFKTTLSIPKCWVESLWGVKRPIRLYSQGSRTWALSSSHLEHVTSGQGWHTSEVGGQGYSLFQCRREVTLAATWRRQ